MPMAAGLNSGGRKSGQQGLDLPVNQGLDSRWNQMALCSLVDSQLRAVPGMMLPMGAALMKDMQVQLERLLNEASECALIAKLATDNAKRELFAKLAEHYNVLAAEVQRAIENATTKR